MWFVFSKYRPKTFLAFFFFFFWDYLYNLFRNLYIIFNSTQSLNDIKVNTETNMNLEDGQGTFKSNWLHLKCQELLCQDYKPGLKRTKDWSRLQWPCDCKGNKFISPYIKNSLRDTQSIRFKIPATKTQETQS